MQNLAKHLTISDDQGENPLHFGFAYSHDYQDDRTAAAIAKAMELEDRGVFYTLWQGTRHFLVTSGHTKETRLVEGLYLSGYLHGYITVRKAVELLEPIYKPFSKHFSKSIRRALEDLCGFVESQRAVFEEAGMGKLFPKSPLTLLVGENVNNFPRSHKQGMGSGVRRGPREIAYWIPPKYLLNYTFGMHDQRQLAIPVRALGSNRTYAAYVGKFKVVEKKGQINGKQTELAAYMNTSRRTMKERMELAGCRVRPQYKMVELNQKNILALPKDKEKRKAARKSGALRFNRVQDQHGRWAYADEESMRGKGLEGKIYAEICVGTIVTDEDCDAWLLEGDQNGS